MDNEFENAQLLHTSVHTMEAEPIKKLIPEPLSDAQKYYFYTELRGFCSCDDKKDLLAPSIQKPPGPLIKYSKAGKVILENTAAEKKKASAPKRAPTRTSKKKLNGSQKQRRSSQSSDTSSSADDDFVLEQLHSDEPKKRPSPLNGGCGGSKRGCGGSKRGCRNLNTTL